MTKVAAYQAPLLPVGSMEAIGLIAAQVRTCESIGVKVLCGPEGVLGGLADYASRPYEIAIDVQNGQLQRALPPILSETVTTILGFTEIGDHGRLFNSASFGTLGIPMKLLRLSMWMVALIASPAVAFADAASVPAACRTAIEARWRNWRLSPPPKDYAIYAKQQRIETNVARADLDDDGTPDVAVLLLTSATRQAQRRLAVCLTRGAGAELHVVREPYCGDGIAVTPKGTKVWDYERETDFTYRVNGIHTLCFEKAGATYIFDRGRLRRVVDSD